MKKIIHFAAVDTLTGALISLLLCSIFCGGNYFLMLMPIWFFIIFFIGYFVFDKVRANLHRK